MGVLKKLLGISSPKKVSTNSTILNEAKKVFSKSKHLHYEDIIMSEFKLLAPKICEVIMIEIHDMSNLSQKEIDRIGNHQIFEVFIRDYALNIYLATWVCNYAYNVNNNTNSHAQLNPITQELGNKITSEVELLFNNSVVTEAFRSAIKLTIMYATEHSHKHLVKLI